MAEKYALGFVGSGKMCEAMISGILAGCVERFSEIIATGPRRERGRELERRYEIATSTCNTDATAADLLILSVKPQTIPTVLGELRGKIPATTTVISIAAGITLSAIVEGLGVRKVVRAMPNTPGRISRGVTVWTSTHAIQGRRKLQVSSLLKSLGTEIFVDNEVYIDMATAVSGTGPAIVFHLVEKYIEAAVRIGIPWRLARQLAMETFRGSVEYAYGSDAHLAQLRNDVTSPAGTTAAALYELEQGQVGTGIANALQAAYDQARKFGK